MWSRSPSRRVPRFAGMFAGLKAAREGATKKTMDTKRKAGWCGGVDARLELRKFYERIRRRRCRCYNKRCDALPAHGDTTRSERTSRELWWLTRLIAHVLADDGDGETPIPPDSLAAASAATAAGASIGPRNRQGC